MGIYLSYVMNSLIEFMILIWKNICIPIYSKSKTTQTHFLSINSKVRPRGYCISCWNKPLRLRYICKYQFLCATPRSARKKLCKKPHLEFNTPCVYFAHRAHDAKRTRSFCYMIHYSMRGKHIIYKYIQCEQPVRGLYSRARF